MERFPGVALSSPFAQSLRSAIKSLALCTSIYMHACYGHVVHSKWAQVFCFFSIALGRWVQRRDISLIDCSSGVGGGVCCQTFYFVSFPCSADHERDWPPCKVVFFGLATNTLNVRNNKQQYSSVWVRGWERGERRTSASYV